MTQLKKITPILVFIFIALAFSSCGKREKIIEELTEGEAVEIIESFLQNNTGGLTSNLQDIATQLVTAVASGELCDTLYSETIEKNHNGTQIQADYTSDLSYEMSCNNLDIPQTVTFSILTSSIYSSQKVNSDDSGDFTGNATGLQPSSTTLIIGGNYKGVGTQDLDFRESKSISSSFTVDLMNIEIDKQSFDIDSGNGIFSFTGSVSGQSFSYNGSIVFTGNKTADLTIDGSTYQANWN